MNHRKLLFINSRIFWGSFIALIIIEIISHLSFLPFTILTGGGCYPLKICDEINAYYILLPLIGIILISGLVILFDKITGRKKVIVIFSIILLLFILLISFNSARCKSYSSARIGVLEQLRIGQELYYDEHGKYAENYEELFSGDARLILEYSDLKTGEKFADRDGNGLEGGDNDFNTWSAQAWIEKQSYKYCLKATPGYWYICNQDGCQRE